MLENDFSEVSSISLGGMGFQAGGLFPCIRMQEAPGNWCFLHFWV